MLNKFSHSRAMIAALADVPDAAMPLWPSFIGTRTGLMIMSLVGGIAGSAVGKLCMTLVFVVVTTLGLAVLVSFAMGVRAALILDTGASIIVRVGVGADLSIDGAMPGMEVLANVDTNL